MKLGMVYVLIMDEQRSKVCQNFIGRGYSVQIDLGEGVEKMDTKQFQFLVDGVMRKNSKVYESCATGKVMDPWKREVKTVVAGNKYMVTGNLKGGYVKSDFRFGPRLSGYGVSSTRQGYNWAGEKR